MNSKKYTNMLEKSLTMMNELLPNGWILQWDNDSKHKSIEALRFYMKKKIKLIELPAHSSHKSHWKYLGNIKRYLSARSYSKISDLKSDIEEHWKEMSIGYCKKLVDSIRNRLKICVVRDGDLTGY